MKTCSKVNFQSYLHFLQEQCNIILTKARFVENITCMGPISYVDQVGSMSLIKIIRISNSASLEPFPNNLLAYKSKIPLTVQIWSELQLIA